MAVLNHSSVASTAIRLLLLESDAANVEEITRRLRDAGLENALSVAREEQQLRAALGSADFDVVLADWRPDHLDAPEVLSLLRDSRRGAPLVLLMDSSRGAAAECLKYEATDYLLWSQLDRLPILLKRICNEQKLEHENALLKQALAESESHASELADNAIYGMFRAHPDGRFVSANETLQKTLACATFDEVHSLNLANEVFRYPETFAKLLNECWENGLVRNAETEWRRRDGGFVAVRLNLRLIRDASNADCIAGVVEDVTEVRALEKQLHQAQKFETIGQLAGGIAHDFNNVLGAVLGWAEIGYDQSREHQQLADYFVHIRQQAERAAALTRELLTFARRQALQPRAVQLNDVIANLMSFLDKVIGKDIEIRVVPGRLLPVKAEPAQIEQVLMNLCINARDAMPDGGLLRLETEMISLDDSFCHFYPGVGAGTYVVLSVSDTGCGMTPEVRDRIFEPFFTTKERGKGSGMGLATVYGVVRQHGGFIHVYSEVGQGTLFHVYLPAMETATTASAQDTGRLTSAKNLHGPETILLAEDHDSIRELVRQSLSRLGYQVLAAADGKQALHLAELQPPALAVLDVVMPQMGGAAAAAELLRRTPGLPILFTSGFSENANHTAAKIPGSHYLQKPYSPTSLASAIREILDS